MTDPVPPVPTADDPGQPGQPNHGADLDLVRRALRRDRDAVNELVRHLSHVPAVVRAKNRRIGKVLSTEEEKDAAQEALTAIWAKLPTFEGRSKLQTWIFGFAATQVLKALQTKARRRVASDPEALETQPAPAEEDPPLDPTVIREAIARLEPSCAEVVRLRHFEDLSFEEISRRTGAKVNTVKARYYRSMPKLQEALLPRWENNKS